MNVSNMISGLLVIGFLGLGVLLVTLFRWEKMKPVARGIQLICLVIIVVSMVLLSSTIGGKKAIGEVTQRVEIVTFQDWD